MRHTSKFVVALLLLHTVGCGGGDDFSKPPENLANVRSKSKKESAPANAENASRKETSPQKDADSSAATKPENATVATAPKLPLASENVDVTEPAATTKTEARSIRDPATAASVEGETVTAGGKTKANLDADKEKKGSVAGAGMSLLAKLKVGGDLDEKKPVNAQAARNVIARTGRFALAAETWFRLRNQLAKRFYVAATPDGGRIAASSGERSLGVLSTQVEFPGKELGWARNGRTVAAVVTEKKEITTQPVTQLPGVLTSLELIQGGDLVLAGTADGRLIARSSATSQNWDIYAQDLFAWQDERRPSTRVADSAVMAIRVINDERLLTISENGECRVWKTSDVVHAPISPLKMTEDQARSPEAPVLTAQSLHSISLPKSPILSIAFSSDGLLCAVVTSDETVTVFNTAEGRIVDTISAARLNDTQPVVALIEAQQMRALIGLADGRILRRALTGGEPVEGVDDAGQATDYEIIFAPDLRDRSGSITAMELKHDGKLLYFGRLDGFVTQFDLPRKQQQLTQQQHNGPVIEIRSTPAGAFTIGEDRIARLIDTPNPPQRGDAQTFKLPTDRALQDKQLIEPDEPLKQDKFTVRRNFDHDVTDAVAAAVTMIGIRPSDPVVALYEHRLRVAPDAEQRAEIREQLLAARSEPSLAKNVGTTSPTKISEFMAEFDFQSKPLRRVVMALSNDGSTLAASQYYNNARLRSAAPDQPVIVWDTPTKTRLRTWRRSKGVFDLSIDATTGVLLPQPFSARMQLLTGDFLPEEREGLSSGQSPDGQKVVIGMKGLPGSATPVLAMQSVDSIQRLTGVEAFGGAVPAVAWSADGSSIFASVRERTQSRLLELDSHTLNVLTEIVAEPMSGQWDIEAPGAPTGTLGVTTILPSPSGKLIATYGHHAATAAPYQLRIWKKSNEKWPQEQVVVVDSKQPMLEAEMTDTPMVFVNQQDSMLALIGLKGVAIVNTRTGDIDDTLELPNLGTRRPVTLLSPDGKLLIAGDQEGKLWIWTLRALKRKPQEFPAQAGPITGLAMSENSRFLATIGEENRIRVWDMAALLEDSPRESKSVSR